MMLTMDKVKKGKDMAISVHGRIRKWSFNFFCLAIFWQKYKSIGIAKVFYIIFSFKSYGQFLHWWFDFFYIVNQGKNIFLYKKKVWQSTLFYPFLARGSIFFPTAFDFVSFWVLPYYWFWILVLDIFFLL